MSVITKSWSSAVHAVHLQLQTNQMDVPLEMLNWALKPGEFVVEMGWCGLDWDEKRKKGRNRNFPSARIQWPSIKLLLQNPFMIPPIKSFPSDLLPSDSPIQDFWWQYMGLLSFIFKFNGDHWSQIDEKYPFLHHCFLYWPQGLEK